MMSLSLVTFPHVRKHAVSQNTFAIWYKGPKKQQIVHKKQRKNLQETTQSTQKQHITHKNNT